MKHIIFILALLFSTTAFAANSTTLTADKPYLRSWTMSFDTTGVECVEINDIKGTYPFIYVGVDETTDGATYDVESAITDNPNETGESSDLPGSSNLTDDEHFSGTIGMPYLCIRIDTCSTCAVSATIYAITGGRR